jgi:hypothetical protein
MKLDNQETMAQINEDSQKEIDDATALFDENMKLVTE